MTILIEKFEISYIYLHCLVKKMIKLPRSDIYEPVNQMKQNKYQRKASGKSNSMKQSK